MGQRECSDDIEAQFSSRQLFQRHSAGTRSGRACYFGPPQADSILDFGLREISGIGAETSGRADGEVGHGSAGASPSLEESKRCDAGSA